MAQATRIWTNLEIRELLRERGFVWSNWCDAIGVSRDVARFGLQRIPKRPGTAAAFAREIFEKMVAVEPPPEIFTQLPTMILLQCYMKGISPEQWCLQNNINPLENYKLYSNIRRRDPDTMRLLSELGVEVIECLDGPSISPWPSLKSFKHKRRAPQEASNNNLDNIASGFGSY